MDNAFESDDLMLTDHTSEPSKRDVAILKADVSVLKADLAVLKADVSAVVVVVVVVVSAARFIR